MSGAHALTMSERTEAPPVLTEAAPPVSCPAGHILASARTVTGWQPCTCEGASAERGILPHQADSCGTCQADPKLRIANTHGHYTWLCRACLLLCRVAVYYDPPHTPAPETDPRLTVSEAGQWIITTGCAPQVFSFYVMRRA